MKLNMTRQLLLAMLICTTGPLFSAFGVQPPDEVEQRGLQQLIRETEESLAKESWLEAVEKLDQAWTMAPAASRSSTSAAEKPWARR